MNQTRQIENLDKIVDKLSQNIDKVNKSLSSGKENDITFTEEYRQSSILLRKIISTYDTMKDNQKKLLNQIKSLELKKINLTKKSNDFKDLLKKAIVKIKSQNEEIKSKLQKVYKKKNYYNSVINILNQYDKNIKDILSEYDYKDLKKNIIISLESQLKKIQTLEKSIYTKNERLEQLNDKINNIKNILRKIPKKSLDLLKLNKKF